MVFKINIADKSGKTFKLELETEEFVGKSLHDKIQGKELLPDLAGYKFEISGTSDKSGFTSMKGVEGIGLKRVLLTYGKVMKRRPRREGKKKRSNARPKGLRLRKTVRGQVISPEITQINLKVLKEGGKKLSEVFPDQNKTKEDVHEDTSHVDQNKQKEEPKQEITEKQSTAEVSPSSEGGGGKEQSKEEKPEDKKEK